MADPHRAQALYRRWRPQSFEDVVGQDHIVRTLKNAVQGDRLAQAYLFTGPRGTGKTSVARILAKAVNCTGEGERPCNACSICVSMTEGRSLDLIEIDAASNTGVDDVRDLREKIGFAPNEARYKVYVVDEVHMLSTAAFNALLKTLEEPPPHAIFVLATTEPHKILDTILSRCQRLDFRRAALATLVSKLERICRAESIEAEPEAIEMVARAATGSVRDAESLLDQLAAAGEPITLAYVRETLGTPADAVVAGIVEALADGDAAGGLRLLGEAFDRGADARNLQTGILDQLRHVLLAQTGLDLSTLPLSDDQRAQLAAQAERMPRARLVRAIHLFNDARPAADLAIPALPLELALVESVMDGRPEAPTPTEERPAPTSARPAPTSARQAPEPARPEPSRPAKAEQAEERAAEPPARQTAPAPDAGPTQALFQARDKWQAVCNAVAQHDRNTAALLRDCRPVAVDDEAVTLGFFYEFHCKRVSEPRRSAIVADALNRALGGKRAVRCTVVAQDEEPDDTPRPRTVADQAAQDPVVRHAVEELGARITSVVPKPEEDAD